MSSVGSLLFHICLVTSALLLTSTVPQFHSSWKIPRIFPVIQSHPSVITVQSCCETGRFRIFQSVSMSWGALELDLSYSYSILQKTMLGAYILTFY